MILIAELEPHSHIGKKKKPINWFSCDYRQGHVLSAGFWLDHGFRSGYWKKFLSAENHFFSVNQNCQHQQVKGQCLTDDLLEYLLESKWEKQHLGNFKQVLCTLFFVLFWWLLVALILMLWWNKFLNNFRFSELSRGNNKKSIFMCWVKAMFHCLEEDN